MLASEDWWRVGRGSAEEDIEGIGVFAAFVVFDENDGGAVGAGFAEEVLGAAAVDALEAEVGGLLGHGAVAIETAPGGGAAFAGVQAGGVAEDLHFGDAIDHDFQGTFPAAAATVDVGRARLCGEQGGGEGEKEKEEAGHAWWMGYGGSPLQ